jgi:predicted MFS family arabinose efflux permease
VVFLAVELRSPHPMFDLGLLRVPTFSGGLIAAWAISASLFSMLTFLVLYLQNVLGYSALQTGVRFLPMTGTIFVCAAIAGRLTDRLPARWLIAPGFALVGAGLLLMRGIDVGDSWTHLLPGFIVAGVGAGLVNVPLASTAVGVVEPERAGMASGINSTLRQVGIATGVAALGSILAGRVRDIVTGQLAGVPNARTIADAVADGRIGQTLHGAAPAARGQIARAAEAGFAGALDTILLIGGVTALVAAVATIVLIRSQDFAHQRLGEPAVAAG